jgi:polyphosphate kinase 2 (PPK2 family)
MLKDTDLSKKLAKGEYKSTMDALGVRLGEAQRACRDEQVPVIVLFEGWSASGKGSRIGTLIRSLDPRGFEVFTIQTPTEEERLHPYMWRFWRRTPAAGRIHVFDRSWYRILIRGREEDEAPLPDPVRDVVSFEKMLADAGVVFVKFFLHVSRKEQKKRLDALAAKPDTAWRVTEADRMQNRDYDDHVERFARVLEETGHAQAGWTVIEADDGRYADAKVCLVVAEAMEEAAGKARARRGAAEATPAELRFAGAAEAQLAELRLAGAQESKFADAQPAGAHTSPLASVVSWQAMERPEYSRRLKDAQKSLGLLHSAMYLQRVPAAAVFEGWDAAGKGGAIKRLVARLDPRGYKVAPSSAPNDIERAHHYLWRYWNEAPKAGHLTVFDRSWYGRVMVERIEGFCTPEEWKRSFREINEFEEQLVDSGVILMKFWLHIDPNEQLRRFEGRMGDPVKQWKITDEDWRNRDKWEQYLEAVDEMLFRTSTAYAPWTIVEADNKLYARVKVVETVRRQLESRLKHFPQTLQRFPSSYLQ